MYVDPVKRESMFGLLDDGFPTIAARIAAAADAGFVWEDVTEPFVRFENDVAVSHVGVIEHRVLLDGHDTVVAGVHAVATRSDHRNRGLARECLNDAMHWIDDRFGVSKLATGVPAVYAPHGFRTLPLSEFMLDHAGGEDRGRPLRADAEHAWFLGLCATARLGAYQLLCRPHRAACHGRAVHV
jgi:GNAT superfamily N-acetyltransferase